LVALRLGSSVDKSFGGLPPKTEPIGDTALGLLQAVYRMRVRCAVEALPYENPKLSAIASTILDGASFAALLDRATERSRGAQLIEAKPEPNEQHSPEELKGPMAKLERY
jgi:hypothetical protein